MKSTKNFILAVVLLCLSKGVFAASESVTNDPPERISNFNQVDTDQNGFISKREASQVPGLVERFSQVDRNADGGISMDEYTALESSTAREGDGT